jgi:hypothetical protein
MVVDHRVHDSPRHAVDTLNGSRLLNGHMPDLLHLLHHRSSLAKLQPRRADLPRLHKTVNS